MAQTKSLLNRLIIACNDGARARSAAARIMSGAEGRARLEGGAVRRLAFAGELSELVRRYGGRPSDHGSALEGVRAAAHKVNAFFIGENRGDAYTTCARIEARAERLYEDAMETDLPAPARLVVARQQAEIVADHAELRRLSMGG
jgi:uncharacterized protein (TIGR02284 family)